MSEDQLDTVKLKHRILLERQQSHLYAELDVSVLINGISMTEGGGIIDFDTLKKSTYVPGTYFIVTCGCGNPGCAGREDGIRVEHDGDVIRWNDLDEKQTWCFAKADLVKEISTLNKELKQMHGLITDKEVEFRMHTDLH